MPVTTGEHPTHMKQPVSITDHIRRLIVLGTPIIIGKIGIIILGFADTMMIGHYNTESLGAASFVNNLFSLVIIGSTGFAYGLTPVIGELSGAGDKTGIGGKLKNALAVNGTTGILLTLCMADPVLQPRQTRPAPRTHAAHQAVLPDHTGVPRVRPAVQRLQTIRRRHHGHPHIHVDPARRQPAQHRRQLAAHLRRGRISRTRSHRRGHFHTFLAHRHAARFRRPVLQTATLPRLPRRLRPRNRQPHRLLPAQRTGLAARLANGHGNRLILTDHHHGRLDRHRRTRRPSGHAHHQHPLFHDVLRHGRCHRRTSQPLPGTKPPGGRAPRRLHRLRPHHRHGPHQTPCSGNSDPGSANCSPTTPTSSSHWAACFSR